VKDHPTLARSAGDRSGAGVGFEPAGIGEAGGVITDLGQQACSRDVPQTREADDDGSIGMLAELSSHGFGEFIGSLAGGLKLFEQGQRLAAEGGLDQGQSVQPWAAEDQVETLDLDLDIPLTPTTDEGGAHLAAGQGGCARWGRGDGQHGACVRTGQATRPNVLEGLEEGGIVLPEQRAELIGYLLPIPDGVLVCARQDGDRLGSLGVDG
jgi:hypothetical protein